MKLTPELLVAAYRSGVFPMGEPEGEIGWYSPDPRAVIELAAFAVPRSLAKTMRHEPFEIRIDADFEGVMRGCADREETWITQEIARAYLALHQAGLAHSVEAWRGLELVGGLYGVALGGAFFGESMFSRAPDASKICLVRLVERMRARGYALLDSQYPTPHLMRFGMALIPRRTYMRRLRAALALPCTFA